MTATIELTDLEAEQGQARRIVIDCEHGTTEAVVVIPEVLLEEDWRLPTRIQARAILTAIIKHEDGEGCGCALDILSWQQA